MSRALCCTVVTVSDAQQHVHNINGELSPQIAAFWFSSSSPSVVVVVVVVAAAAAAAAYLHLQRIQLTTYGVCITAVLLACLGFVEVEELLTRVSSIVLCYLVILMFTVTLCLTKAVLVSLNSFDEDKKRACRNSSDFGKNFRTYFQKMSAKILLLVMFCRHKYVKLYRCYFWWECKWPQWGLLCVRRTFKLVNSIAVWSL